MGIEVSRIEKEFILNSVSDHQIQLRLTGEKKQSIGDLKSIDEDFIEVSGQQDLPILFPSGSKMRVYFSYYGHVMTFKTVVRSVFENGIKIDAPDSIYRNLKRKFERVPAPENLRISFVLLDKKVTLNFPKTEEYDPVDFPEHAAEYDSTNLEELIESFREKTKHKVSINKINMFRDAGPKTFEEQIIVQTGRILFIPNTSGRFPENDYQIGGKIITRAMMLQQSNIDSDEDASHDRLPSMMASKRDQGIKAELYCPIIYHEYVVGYIYLAKREGKEGAFDHDLLELAFQFAKVLAYSLKIGGYFKGTIPEANTFESDIIDISASGLMFADNSSQLGDTLQLYTDLDLNLEMPDRTMRIGSRIMRKYQSTNVTFFGVQFMELKPEDFRFLFDYIYGRDVTQEDEQLWEGGSEPPELDF